MKKFDGVEDTLFIPLAGRIYASKHFKEYFYDEKALELEEYLPLDAIQENTDEYFTVASFSRIREFDELVKKFISKHENANVVCLGCGFETMYFRIKPTSATFYEVDMPEVIRQRKLVLGEKENEILIGSNILDYTWMDKVDKTRPTIMIVSGVFQYLHREDIVKLIKEIQTRFENVEMVFDCMNTKGLKKANDYIKQTGNNDATIYFALDKVDEFAKECGVKLVDVLPFYDTLRKVLKKKLKFMTRMLCYFGDKLGYTKLVYLKIK